MLVLGYDISNLSRTQMTLSQVKTPETLKTTKDIREEQKFEKIICVIAQNQKTNVSACQHKQAKRYNQN